METKIFFGGGFSSSSSISQLIDVSSLASNIDSGSYPYTLSGYLGGFASQSDQAALRVEFQNSSGVVLGTGSIGPVLPAVGGGDKGPGKRIARSSRHTSKNNIPGFITHQ